MTITRTGTPAEALVNCQSPNDIVKLALVQQLPICTRLKLHGNSHIDTFQANMALIIARKCTKKVQG